jgi:Tfp pilus assembly protein PilX
MSITPVRRLHSDERGIALIVVMAMLLIIGILTAAVFTNSLNIKNATDKERAGKQAFAAAVNGLRSAMYWLNASAPDDAVCPPLPGQATPQGPNTTSGLCGPYESDNMSGLGGVATQPLIKQRFTYWISPVISTGGDTCTGHPPAVTQVGTGTTVRDRCITAIGQSLNGNQITSTRRIQARVSATNAQFPVPGIFGAACLSIGVNVHAGDTTCSTQGSGVSNSDYYGTIGSNGTVLANMKSWSYDPESSTLAPAELYLGYSSPTASTIPQYTVKLQNNPVGTPNPSGCPGSGLNYCNNSLPPLPYNTSATGPYTNPVHLFGTWYQPFRMGDFFAHPEVFAKFVIPGHALPVGCIPPWTDVSQPACNNNSSITTASSTPLGCATVSSNRALNVPQGCVLTLQDGTYDFCDITVGRSAALMPADATPNAEIRIFLDNKLRTVTTQTGSSAACANSTQGDLNWPNNNFPRWMTNNGTQVSAADCINSAFSGDNWTALAGQLYVYGAGDPTDATTNYPVNASDAVDFPGLNFNGSIMATNSTVNLTDSSTCINGGITGGQVNIANNAGFKWDANIAKAHLSDTAKTFYRTAFSTCTAAGFRFSTTTAAPTYPTYPSDGC